VQKNQISLEILIKRTMFFGKSKYQEDNSPAGTSAQPLARLEMTSAAKANCKKSF
jgi:hypothetical protein